MDTFVQDLRYALRSLARQRLFTLAALLCLGLGIGMSTAVYTLVNAILLRPLPIQDADRLVSLYWTNFARDIDDDPISLRDLEEFRDTGMFEDVAAVAVRGVTLTGGDRAERVQAASITPNLFGLIGAQPQLGRGFRPEDAAAIGFEQAVVLGHGLWQRQFGGARDVIGRTLQLNGRTLTVVGVMPAGFRFPRSEELWLPLGPTDPAGRASRNLWGMGRLRRDVPMAAAAERVREAGERLLALEPVNTDQVEATLLTYRDTMVDRSARRALWLMLGAVIFVLLIACANVASLLLARAADRRRELAVRSALGASRLRVARQLLTESLVLAVAGAVLGLVLAFWWVDAFVKLIPEELPYWVHFDIDASVVLFTAALAASTAVLFGLLPALHAGRDDTAARLKQGGRSGESRESVRLRAGLVVAEIALSLVLLVGASLMMQSFMRVLRAEVGFSTDHMLTMRAQLTGDRYDTVAVRAQTWQQVTTRLRTVPGIAGAAVTSAIPADDGGPTIAVTRTGESADPANAVIAMEFASGTGYFDALGLRLIAGRDFRPEEASDTAARAVILGQRLARRLFPDGDAVDRTIRIGPDALEHTIIGIAPDLQYDEFGEDLAGTRYQLHLPYARFAWRSMALLVRGTGDPAALTGSVRATLAAVDPLLVPYDVFTFEGRRRYTQWNYQVFGNTFAIFALTALLLAVAGVYGVMSQSVASRRHEFGVRLALGQAPAGVVRMMLGRAARLALAGIAIGALASIPATRFLRGLLFDVRPGDPRTLLAVALALAGAALLASWVPARRAARADPLDAMRAE